MNGFQETNDLLPKKRFGLGIYAMIAIQLLAALLILVLVLKIQSTYDSGFVNPTFYFVLAYPVLVSFTLLAATKESPNLAFVLGGYILFEIGVALFNPESISFSSLLFSVVVQLVFILVYLRARLETTVSEVFILFSFFVVFCGLNITIGFFNFTFIETLYSYAIYAMAAWAPFSANVIPLIIFAIAITDAVVTTVLIIPVLIHERLQRQRRIEQDMHQMAENVFERDTDYEE